MSDIDLDELRTELDDFAQPEKKGGRSPREERIIAGFEEIQRFVEKHGRAPQHSEDRDIFERLYAVRLDRLRDLEECRSLLQPLDHQGLLAGADTVAATPAESMDEDELLAELGVEAGAAGITELRHVRTSSIVSTPAPMTKPCSTASSGQSRMTPPAMGPSDRGLHLRPIRPRLGHKPERGLVFGRVDGLVQQGRGPVGDGGLQSRAVAEADARSMRIRSVPRFLSSPFVPSPLRH
jgi:hypothetical protein